MPKRPALRVRGTGHIDGLVVRAVDDPAASGAAVGQALRMLAGIMVRGHHAAGDHEAIIPDTKSSSELTVAPRGRRVDTDEAA